MLRMSAGVEGIRSKNPTPIYECNTYCFCMTFLTDRGNLSQNPFIPCTIFPNNRSTCMPGQSLFLRSAENTDRSLQVDRFLAARGVGSGRLVFALDATASRLPLWSVACELTANMIQETASIGTLSLQLVYFRGGVDSPSECVASQWTSDSVGLARLMAKVECQAGYTQIARVPEARPTRDARGEGRGGRFHRRRLRAGERRPR